MLLSRSRIPAFNLHPETSFDGIFLPYSNKPAETSKQPIKLKPIPDQQLDDPICPSCQLPREPSYSPSTQCSPSSPSMSTQSPPDPSSKCYCPDIRMPAAGESPPSSIAKPHIRRRSTLSEVQGETTQANAQMDVERRAGMKGRIEMSPGAWL